MNKSIQIVDDGEYKVNITEEAESAGVIGGYRENGTYHMDYVEDMAAYVFGSDIVAIGKQTPKDLRQHLLANLIDDDEVHTLSIAPTVSFSHSGSEVTIDLNEASEEAQWNKWDSVNVNAFSPRILVFTPWDEMVANKVSELLEDSIVSENVPSQSSCEDNS